MREPAGVLPDGRVVEAVTLASGQLSARIMTLGASLQRFAAPDREGKPANLVLGRDHPADYLDPMLYLSPVVGRYANRIARGRFSLDGVDYQIPLNDPPNNLHGGPNGFETAIWTIEAHDEASVTLSLVSPAGENGFPGTLHVTARYAIEGGALALTLEATTDAPTVVSLTHHAYWNLAGTGTIEDHWLQIPASRYTPVDAGQIPEGPPAPVTGTPLDFTAPKPIGRDVEADHPQLVIDKGFDQNFALDTVDGTLRRVATLFDPGSGRVMDLLSDHPGLQFYSGNKLPAPHGKRAGLCLEPQLFPDSPNRPDFASARLDPGETYRHHIVFRFRTADDPESAFSE